MPTRPCWVEIDTRALKDNYRFLRNLAGSGTECLAIVKANAYGHGLTICGPAAVAAGARWLGVTSVEEGIALRAVCPEARILVMGGLFDGQAAKMLAHKLTPVVWDAAHFEMLVQAAAGLPAESVPVHLEIDTGMSRQGASREALPGILRSFAGTSSLRVEAVMTHLYASDEPGAETTTGQLARLDEAMAMMGEAASRAEFLSVGASAALLGGEAEYVARLASRWKVRPMLRLGLALYGIAPRFEPPFAADHLPAAFAEAAQQLRPVLTWKTRIASLRSVPPGAEVGYNGTFIATEPMRLALLPAGYADGLDRKLGNNFCLLVRGQRSPLVGRVSMDQAVLDVTDIAGVETADEVVILGRQGGDEVTAFDHAEVCGTIPWEVLTRIAARVPRVEIA